MVAKAHVAAFPSPSLMSTDSTPLTAPVCAIRSSTTQAIRSKLRKIRLNPYHHYHDFFDTIVPIFNLAELDHLRAAIKDLDNGHNNYGCLRITGLPIDDTLPQTPTKFQSIINKTHYFGEAGLAYVASLLGTPTAYKGEQNNNIIHNVYPIKGNEHSRSHAGCESDFELHTEIAFHTHRPDFIGLYAQRTELKNNPVTTVADIRRALALLKKTDVDILMQQRFNIGKPESFSGSVTVSNKPVAVLIPTANGHKLRVNFNTTTGIDQQASQALVRLYEALNHPSVLTKNNLQPGELLLINNQFAVHGRHAFKSALSGNSRWLIRLYIRSLSSN